MLKGDGIVRADALTVPAADAMVLVDCHLAIGVHRDDFLWALLGAVAATRAFLVVDYCRETSAAESVLYGAVRVLANIERHAAARAAEADFHELIHLLIFEAPNHLLEFDIQRLPDQTGIAGIVDMLLSLFFRYRLCHRFSPPLLPPC